MYSSTCHYYSITLLPRHPSISLITPAIITSSITLITQMTCAKRTPRRAKAQHYWITWAHIATCHAIGHWIGMWLLGKIWLTETRHAIHPRYIDSCVRHDISEQEVARKGNQHLYHINITVVIHHLQWARPHWDMHWSHHRVHHTAHQINNPVCLMCAIPSP